MQGERKASEFQQAVLDHLLGKNDFRGSEESSSAELKDKVVYTCVPDYHNLTIVTLLYCESLLDQDKNVALCHSYDFTKILADLPDFEEYYNRKIKNRLVLFNTGYSDVVKTTEDELAKYHLVGLNLYKSEVNIQKNVTTGRVSFIKNFPFPVAMNLHLCSPPLDMAKVHPLYVEEQTNKVWVCNRDAFNYKFEKESTYISIKTLPTKNLVSSIERCSIDAGGKHAYAVYCALTMFNDKLPMITNYVSYPTDYGSGTNYGDYLFPLQFYLDCPKLFDFVSCRGDAIVMTDGLTVVEMIFLTHRFKRGYNKLYTDWLSRYNQDNIQHSRTE
jgi:hypothetical protein